MAEIHDVRGVVASRDKVSDGFTCVPEIEESVYNYLFLYFNQIPKSRLQSTILESFALQII